MAGISKDKWADLWATVKSLRTKDLEGLNRRIEDELAGRYDRAHDVMMTKALAKDEDQS